MLLQYAIAVKRRIALVFRGIYGCGVFAALTRGQTCVRSARNRGRVSREESTSAPHAGRARGLDHYPVIRPEHSIAGPKTSVNATRPCAGIRNASNVTGSMGSRN